MQGMCFKTPRSSSLSRNGLRASEFGDIVFVYHTDVKIADEVYVVLVILDSATNLIWVAPLQSKIV